MPKDSRKVLVSIMESLKRADPKPEILTEKQLETALNYRGVSSHVSIQNYLKMFRNFKILKPNFTNNGSRVFKIDYESYEEAILTIKNIDKKFKV